MSSQVLIVAAEASADAHAAEVVRALRARGAKVETFGIAGPALRAAGTEAVARTEDLSVMGLVDVVVALPRILGIVRRLMREVRRREPTLALLVDSPDLNLRLAGRLHRRGVKVLYYIGPTLWAWRSGRARTLRRFVERVLLIFPFEEAVYARLGVPATYVGNPLLDAGAEDPVLARSPAEVRASLGIEVDDAPIVALLPGSRRAEIERCFPRLLEAARRLAAEHPGLVFVVPVAPTLDPGWLETFVARHGEGLDLHLLQVPARQVLRVASVAAVVSGTATLEAALERVPHVVVYRFDALAWRLARWLVHLPHWSLVNLVAERAVVPERVQAEATPERIAADLGTLLSDGEARQRVLEGLEEVGRRLGGPGAAGRVAETILDLLGEEAS